MDGVEKRMSENLSFFRNKRILVTGHTGFKGSWLCWLLLLAGADVTGYALDPPTTPNFFDQTGLSKKIRSITGDVRDQSMLCNVVTCTKPEVVFHLAAQPLVRYSYEHPLETYQTNLMGTVHLLEAIRQSETVRTVVIVTTDKVYENQELNWGYRETDHLGGSDPYASSKACAELAAAAYNQSFLQAADIRIATARAGNVIGGGDYAADRILPDCIRFAKKNKPIPLRHPNAIRPWQYVIEPLFGYLLLAQHLEEIPSPTLNSAFNFGPNDSDTITVGTLVSLFCNVWGKGSSWTDVGNQKEPHETLCLKLNHEKAQALLNWHPRLSVSQAVKWTVEWERAEDKVQATIAQIRRYLDTSATEKKEDTL